mmetsp:Transcript_5471/g.13781  ORF Transcript_5471/g.13781 Transcript_5471/m.13781 type:complete len:602 (-) Transcript_5471:23-1828(-)
MVSTRALRHAAVAGVAIATGIFLELLKNAPAPRRGNPIRELLYDVKLERLENETMLANTFLKSQPDAELAAFLAESAAATNSTLGRVKALAKRRLFWGLQRWLGLSRTDASGLLSMATLYVGSHQQFKDLVNGTAASLLDVGSGTGTETQKLASILEADDVACLESSKAMRVTLRGLGFRAEATPDELGDDAFAAASLLNVLDRCDEPGALLNLVADRVADGGLVLVASVLPYSPMVHEGRFLSPYGKAQSRRAKRPLQVKPARTFEQGAINFVQSVQAARPGLELESWTRLPYVSSGDTGRTHYVLDQAVFAFRNSMSDAPPAACAKRGDDQIYKWLGTHFEEGGTMLDAGTGFGSLCWLLRRSYDSLTAVTATDEGMYGAKPLREMTRNRNVSVVIGNWRDSDFLSDQTYDIVVADYLFGATERYWAYGADELLGRLLDRVRPGGTLLIVGLEPYELVLDRNDKDDKLILEVEAVGDAAATAAFEPNYRELPERWISERIARTPSFSVVATEQFPMRLTARSLQRQLVFARDCLVKIEDDGLRAAFEARVRALDKELSVWARKGKSHRRARNYAIVVRRAAQEGEAAPKKPKRRFFGKN